MIKATIYSGSASFDPNSFGYSFVWLRRVAVAVPARSSGFNSSFVDNEVAVLFQLDRVRRGPAARSLDTGAFTARAYVARAYVAGAYSTSDSGRDESANRCRSPRPEGRFHSRNSPHPFEPLLELSWARRTASPGGAAARRLGRGADESRNGIRRHRGRQAGRERADRPDRIRRRLRSHAAPCLKETAVGRTEETAPAVDRTGSRIRPALGVRPAKTPRGAGRQEQGLAAKHD